MKHKKIIRKVLTLAGLLLLPHQARTNFIMYDDFSSGILDVTKWSESQFQGHPFVDEHFVNGSSQTYIARVNSVGDKEVLLTPTREFVSGESLLYDLIYNSGSGNHLSQVLIDGNYPPETIPQITPNPGSGTIGFWNGIPDVGNTLGTYQIRQDFHPDRIEQTVIRPDGSSISHSYKSVIEPYTFSINLHTGGNGLMNYEIDNVRIGTIPEPTTIGLGSLIILLGLGLKRLRNQLSS